MKRVQQTVGLSLELIGREIFGLSCGEQSEKSDGESREEPLQGFDYQLERDNSGEHPALLNTRVKWKMKHCKTR